MALVAGPVTVKNALAVPPLAVGSMPVTPVVSGKPVAFVRVPDDGVPSAGVTRVGEVAKTKAPLPVSSEITPANWLLVVAANCESGFDVSASPPPPPPLALIVILSALGSVVIVTFVPATKVSVSPVESATTLLCPETAIVENRL